VQTLQFLGPHLMLQGGSYQAKFPRR
jgi:hypothetical protein